MPSFSQTSKRRLATCHPDIQKLFNKVIEYRDCTVVWGFRDKDAQNEALENGHSTKPWPQSMHNYTYEGPSGDRVPFSLAADVVPYHQDPPHIRWKNDEEFFEFSGYVKRVADELGILIRHGYDWDMDLQFDDQTLMDGAHFELVLEI